jgi:hypothetical protein
MRYARYLDSFNLIYTAESEYCKYYIQSRRSFPLCSLLRPLFPSPIHTLTKLSRPLRKPHNSKLTLMPHHILRNLLTGIPLFSAPRDREASYVSPCGVVRQSQGLFRHPLAVPYCGRGREGDIGKLMLKSQNPPGRKGTWTWDGLKDVIGFHAIHDMVYTELSKRNATQTIDQTISGGYLIRKTKGAGANKHA